MNPNKILTSSEIGPPKVVEQLASTGLDFHVYQSPQSFEQIIMMINDISVLLEKQRKGKRIIKNLKKLNEKVIVFSDSKYVVDAVEKGWVFAWEKTNFSKKKNPDLWIRFLKIYRKHLVSFSWVKGHANNVENERCDFLAVESSEMSDLKIDTWYEKSKEKNSLF